MELLKSQLEVVIYAFFTSVEKFTEEHGGWQDTVGFLVSQMLKVVYALLLPVGALLVYSSIVMYEYLCKYMLVVYKIVKEQLSRQIGSSTTNYFA